MNNCKIKTILKNCCFFVLLYIMLLAVSKACVWFAVSTGNKGTLKRNEIEVELEEEKPHSLDVLAVGDSECYTTFSPMQVWEKSGVTSFLCSQSGQTAGESRHLLNLALQRQNPKVVFLETNLLFEYKGMVGSSKDLVMNTMNDVLPIIQYHSAWKAAFKTPKKAKSFKGFNVYSNVQPSQFGKEYMNTCKPKSTMYSYEKWMLRYIHHMVKKAGAELVLYSAPSPKNYNYDRDRQVREMAKELNVDYINMNLKPELGIDMNRDILDGGDHVNISGAEKTTAFFIDYLKRYKLKDKRGVEKYDDWNKKAKLYKKITNPLIDNIRSM